MAAVVRRGRGLLLRLARRRGVATIAGLMLVVPAGWVQYTGRGAWWLQGLSLIVGATGLALLWTGLFGLRPDWTE
jgi:hypothetical protein